MACSGRGQDMEKLVQLHPSATAPNQTPLLQGNTHNYLFSPLLQVHNSGYSFNTPSERWGKVPNRAKFFVLVHLSC